MRRSSERAAKNGSGCLMMTFIAASLKPFSPWFSTTVAKGIPTTCDRVGECVGQNGDLEIARTCARPRKIAREIEREGREVEIKKEKLMEKA